MRLNRVGDLRNHGVRSGVEIKLWLIFGSTFGFTFGLYMGFNPGFNPRRIRDVTTSGNVFWFDCFTVRLCFGLRQSQGLRLIHDILRGLGVGFGRRRRLRGPRGAG